MDHGDGRWYFVRDGERFGPVGLPDLQAQLQSGRIRQTDLVWSEDMPDWREARDVDGLYAPPALAPYEPPPALYHAPHPPPGPAPYYPAPYPGAQVAHFAPQAQFVQPHPYPYPAPAPYPVAAYPAVAVVHRAPGTTTGLKVAGFIFNILLLPGLGSFFVSRPGQAVAQLLLFIIGLGVSITLVGAVIGVPMMIGAWIWGIVTVATVPTIPQAAVIHQAPYPHASYPPR